MHTELRILMRWHIGVALNVLLPQQHQCHAFAPQLVMDLAVVWQDNTAGVLLHPE